MAHKVYCLKLFCHKHLMESHPVNGILKTRGSRDNDPTPWGLLEKKKGTSQKGPPESSQRGSKVLGVHL